MHSALSDDLLRRPFWDGELVKARLIEAREIEAKLPHVGTRRLTTTWPAKPIHTFADVTGWSDASERVLQSWERSASLAAWQVTRMEEALDWLRLLKDEDERRALDAWALSKAVRRFRLNRIMKRLDVPKTTFYRRVNDGAANLAMELNRRGVQVR